MTGKVKKRRRFRSGARDSVFVHIASEEHASLHCVVCHASLCLDGVPLTGDPGDEHYAMIVERVLCFGDVKLVRDLDVFLDKHDDHPIAYVLHYKPTVQ